MTNKKKPEDPTIELFLSTPGAEYAPEIEPVPSQVSMQHHWPFQHWCYVWCYRNWCYVWCYRMYPWPCDISPIGRMPSLGSVEIRKEDFGALAYDPGTHRVFKLNPTGTELLEKLKEGKNPDEIQKELGLNEKTFNTFMETLRKFSLWRD